MSHAAAPAESINKFLLRVLTASLLLLMCFLWGEMFGEPSPRLDIVLSVLWSACVFSAPRPLWIILLSSASCLLVLLLALPYVWLLRPEFIDTDLYLSHANFYHNRIVWASMLFLGSLVCFVCKLFARFQSSDALTLPSRQTHRNPEDWKTLQEIRQMKPQPKPPFVFDSLDDGLIPRFYERMRQLRENRLMRSFFWGKMSLIFLLALALWYALPYSLSSPDFREKHDRALMSELAPRDWHVANQVERKYAHALHRLIRNAPASQSGSDIIQWLGVAALVDSQKQSLNPAAFERLSSMDKQVQPLCYLSTDDADEGIVRLLLWLERDRGDDKPWQLNSRLISASDQREPLYRVQLDP